VYQKLDLPNTALDTLSKACVTHLGDARLLLAAARLHDALSDAPQAALIYTAVAQLDPACVEAIACLAANHFYADQPEVYISGLATMARLLLVYVVTATTTAALSVDATVAAVSTSTVSSVTTGVNVVAA
jgi:hypothetical protein